MLREAIGRALRLITEHPAFTLLESAEDPETGAVQAEVSVRLELPNAWMADGISPNGVRAVEPVTILLPSAFPLRPPRIFLRADFDRGLAHVIPGAPSERPMPCIYDGSVLELLQGRGFAEVLNQLVVWLENAALERLIDKDQGWEPVRRDNLDDIVVADAEHLRSLVKREEGHLFFPLEYLSYVKGERISYYGGVGRDHFPIHSKKVGDLFDESRLSNALRYGHGVAIFVWPGKRPSGEPVFAERYLPETVTDIHSLMERAGEYGCAAPLQAALKWLAQCLGTDKTGYVKPLAIILCARRPFHMIGSISPLELCPYLVEIGMPEHSPIATATPVRTAAHRHVISAPLLRSMSERDVSEDTPFWVQIGAGSLGSKIALHLARAGRAPRIVIDRANLSPHNAARHVLVPRPDPTHISWMVSKASALVEAIKGLGQEATAYDDDIIWITGDAKRTKQILSKGWAIVNSTASLAVREALASVPAEVTIPRIVETSLFASGRVGLLSVEGPARNPNTGDLIAEAYSLIAKDDMLRNLVFGEGDISWQPIGEGCGSETMVVSDARLSMLAAPMAEFLASMQIHGLPNTHGSLLLGLVGEDNMSQVWKSYEILPWLRSTLDGHPSWSVRLSDSAHKKVLEEIARWPGVETGGILVGRFSEAAQTFYVVDVLPAPEDSKRSAVEFVLGTIGVRALLNAYVKNSGKSLYCLGTWHSHLNASGPSITDRSTAEAVALARLMPSVLLIYTPAGYRALLADVVLSPSKESKAIPTSVPTSGGGSSG